MARLLARRARPRLLDQPLRVARGQHPERSADDPLALGQPVRVQVGLLEQRHQFADPLHLGGGRTVRREDRPAIGYDGGRGRVPRHLLGAGGLVAGEHDDLPERRPERPADRPGLRHRADRVRLAVFHARSAREHSVSAAPTTRPSRVRASTRAR